MKQMVLLVFLLGLLSLSGGQLMAAPYWGNAQATVYASSDWDYRRLPKPSKEWMNERADMIRRLPPPSLPSRSSKKAPFLTAGLVVAIVSAVVALWQWVKSREQESISPSMPSFDLTTDPAPVPQQPWAPSQDWPQQSDYPQMPPQSPWEQPYPQPQPQQPWAPSQDWSQQSDYPQMSPQSPWEQPYPQPQPQQPWAPSQDWSPQSDYPQMPTSPQVWQQPGLEQGYQGGPQRQ